jgi:STE24 endopeptidase
MLDILVGVYSFYILISIYTAVMQIGFVSQAKKQNPILLNQSDYNKAADYEVGKQRVAIVEFLLDFVLFFFWVSTGFKMLDSMILESSEIYKAVYFVLAFVTINYIVSLPIDYYKSFVLDKKFGFTKNLTLKLYLSDMIKGALLFYIFGGIVIAGMAYFITSYELWWFYSFVFLFSVIVVINIVYPIIRGTMFDKFTELEDGELKSKILGIMDQVGFKSSGIFVVDASKRDSRLNAYFGGLGSTKRVVLFDTLIQKLSTGELVAVLGHELGHFKNKDIIKNIAIMGVVMFAIFALIGSIPEELYLELGVAEGAFSIITIFMLVSTLISFVAMPIISMISRHNEYEADKFGSDIGSKEELASGLIKLVNENLSFPKSHPMYIFFYYSHPPLPDRLKELGYNIEDNDEAMKSDFVDAD